MAADRPELAVEEYRALRATIRERGTTRVVVTVITFVSWAALALLASTLDAGPPLGLIPLLVLAVGFEAAFALHVGVERIGRFIQAQYEVPNALPAWEQSAMKIGTTPGASGGVDPIFFWPFCMAVLLNLMVVLLLQWSPAAIVFGLIHGVVVARLLSARRFARRQREQDLAAFRG
jgi:hypothetical protein